MQGHWSNFKAPDFRDLPADQIAVLPLGATEQHGPHLPLSVDSDLVAATLARTLTLLKVTQNVVVLPTLTITKSNEHMRHPGTLTLGAKTLLAVLQDVLASVARAGVARVLMLNGHGGNTAILEVAARDARIAHDMIVATASWSAFAKFDPRPYLHDLHAGAFETSAMLAAQPARVDMGKAQNFRTAMQDWEAEGRRTGLSGQPARPGWIIDDLNPEGALGDATAATAEVGEALLDSAAAGLQTWLEDFATFDLAGRG